MTSQRVANRTARSNSFLRRTLVRMRHTKFSFPPVPPSSSSPASAEAAVEPSPKRRRVGEATTEPAAEMKEAALERLRGVVRDSVGKHLYASAIFLADKVAAATGDPADVYMLAQALFLGRHYRRALHLLNNSRLLRDLRFRFLAAKCLEELKEWHQCLLMLGDAKVDEHGNLLDQDDGSDIYFDKDAEDHEINIKSAICFLRGKAYEALDNRDLARQWYKAAIKADPLCYEALECLVDNYMLTCEEESELLSSLQFGKEDGWLSAFYSCLIRKFTMHYTFPISKATGLDGTFPPAWIGTGIAYAAQEEGDQAMAAFRTAARLFPGCHLPTLYMGMQYVRMHNFKLAEQFFMQAKSICPSDPLIYNELGVVAYNNKEYQKAVQWFELTLDHTSSSLNEMWEPTLVNLGHALRKLKEYQKAVTYYEKALTFPTKSLSAFAGLAYTYHLMVFFCSF
ncbi:hypothetical protein PR202_ga26464 [Eleusine coracana subsp. coracana]|uniref:Anaphase-promoting complex subunit 6 n=1 Tax=Eleusine coracana subsp. coracana TaxID=191504 RepID=A0AAV5DF16_ELECO|nr:hypothetical protein PR202_ga26464 [Eleusine coracana subsp. coracana]